MSNVIEKLDLYTISCLKLQSALSTNILLFLPGSLSHQHTTGGTMCMVHMHPFSSEHCTHHLFGLFIFTYLWWICCLLWKWPATYTQYFALGMQLPPGLQSPFFFLLKRNFHQSHCRKKQSVVQHTYLQAYVFSALLIWTDR